MNNKILLITSGARPIPAVLGGATQTMMTHIIDVNEDKKIYDFHIVNPYCQEAIIESSKYKHTTFYFLKSGMFDKSYSLFWRLIRKLSKGRFPIKTLFVKRCHSIIKKIKPNIVLVEGNYFQCCQLRDYVDKSKLLLHIHIDGLNKDLDLAERIVADCDGIITISYFCRNRVLKIKGSQNKRVKVLKNTIDVNHFIPTSPITRNVMRKKLRIDNSNFVITYCGRLCVDKGVKQLLEALREIADPKISLLIIGTPAYQGERDDTFVKLLRVTAQNMVSQVIFTGYVPQEQLPDYYGASDLFILPSICNEAAGNVIIEAFACGLPVISTKQGGIPEYANPKASILVDANEHLVENLKEAIQKLRSDNNLYLTLKSNARKCALQYDKYSYYHHFDELMKYFICI